MHIKLTLCCVLLALVSTSSAASFTFEKVGNFNVLAIRGNIESGDYGKFKKMINPMPVELSYLLLDSPGGDLIEALKLAETVHLLSLSVRVDKDKVCASACFFILLGGNDRVATGAINGERNLSGGRKPGYVGLHRPYIKDLGPSDASMMKQRNAMKLVKSYLEMNMVSTRLIDKLLSRPSNDVYWLSEEDLEELGPYPPDREELYISSCKYDRKFLKQANAASRQGNEALGLQIMESHNDVWDCVSRLIVLQEIEGLLDMGSPKWNPLARVIGLSAN
jgi:hypothetical protein